MIEELTTKMHSELSVSRETEVCHRAGCVWLVVNFDASKELVTAAAKDYGITYEAAMKYRDYWRKKKEETKRRRSERAR